MRNVSVWSNSMYSEIILPKQGAVPTETQPGSSASQAGGDMSLETGASFLTPAASQLGSPAELPLGKDGGALICTKVPYGLAAALFQLCFSVFLQ